MSGHSRNGCTAALDCNRGPLPLEKDFHPIHSIPHLCISSASKPHALLGTHHQFRGGGVEGLRRANRASQARRFSGSRKTQRPHCCHLTGLAWPVVLCALLCVLCCGTHSVTCPVASTTTAADGQAGGQADRTCDEDEHQCSSTGGCRPGPEPPAVGNCLFDVAANSIMLSPTRT